MSNDQTILRASVLLSLLKPVVHAISTDQSKPKTYRQVQLTCDGTTLRAVAMDGHRLALCETEEFQTAHEFAAEIPEVRGVIKHLKQVTQRKAPVYDPYVAITREQMVVQGTTPEIFPLMPDTFPPWAHLFEAGDVAATIVVKNTEKVANGLSRIQDKGVLSILGANIAVTIPEYDTQAILFANDITAPKSAPDIRLNLTYLRDAVAAVDSELVRVEWSGKFDPLLFTALGVSDVRFKTLVMPVRD